MRHSDLRECFSSQVSLTLYFIQETLHLQSEMDRLQGAIQLLKMQTQPRELKVQGLDFTCSVQDSAPIKRESSLALLLKTMMTKTILT